jgi:hypothetical protein
MGFEALVSGQRFMSLRHIADECPHVKQDEPRVTYCGYTIIVSAIEDHDKRNWSAKGIVSWANGRQIAYVPGQRCLPTKIAAERHALELAKSWVDQRMGTPVSAECRPKD